MEPTKLQTVMLNDEPYIYHYGVYDPYEDKDKIIIRKGDYESIEAIECKSLLNSIIMKSGWYDFIEEDIDHYYYKCNKGGCNDVIVFYVNRDEHNYNFHTSNCCIII